MESKNQKADYTYDVPIEDLERDRLLPAGVVLQWLEDFQDFLRRVTAVESGGERRNLTHPGR